MAALKHIALAAAASLLALGCGDPLVDAGYRGEPLAQLQGEVSWAGDGTAPDAGLVRAALFFAPDLQTVDPAAWTEARGTSAPVHGIPSAFDLDIFAFPAAALDVRDAGAAYAVGRLLVYTDANANGHYDPDEPLLGIEPPAAWLYAPEAVDAAHSPTGRALPPGLSHIIVPQRCVAPPEPTTPGDCGVPLGERCSVDGDCGANGRCLKETKMPWRAGYCIVAEPVPDGGCRPGAGVFEGAPRYSLTPPDITGFWLRRCEADADCVRPQDRDQGLYTCDLGLGACVPLGPGIGVPLGGRLEVESFCASDHRGP